MSILGPDGQPITPVGKPLELFASSEALSLPTWIIQQRDQIKNMQRTQLIQLLRDLQYGMGMFKEKSEMAPLTPEEEKMYGNLVDFSVEVVKALGLEKVIETADAVAMSEGEQA
jgi:hypothetical protein